MPGPKKFLTPKQTKFAELIVYGIEGSPITKSEAARLAGYSDFASEGSKLTNPKYFPLVCAYISNLQDEVRQKYGITFEGHLEEKPVQNAMEELGFHTESLDILGVYEASTFRQN